MPQFHVSIQFNWSESFMQKVPAHRTYINYLINKGIVEHYAVSLEAQQAWMTLTADNKEKVEVILRKSPLFAHWHYQIAELAVLDGQHYRFPMLQLN